MNAFLVFSPDVLVTPRHEYGGMKARKGSRQIQVGSRGDCARVSTDDSRAPPPPPHLDDRRPVTTHVAPYSDSNSYLESKP